jgi:hypothetical protein
MAKKSNNLLLIGGIGVVAYLLWKKSTAAPPVAALPGAAIPTTLNNYTTAPAINTATAGPVSAPANNVPADIYQWIATISPGNQVQAKNALLLMSPAEIASLEDIVHNDFYGNGITTSAQRLFWDTWRVKYHVLDGTVN